MASFTPQALKVLDEAEAEAWQSILAAEAATPKPAKGKKPEPEVLAQIREIRARKKEFLENLSEDKRQALTAPPPPPSTGQKKKRPEEDHEHRVKALRDFSIKDELNQVCELVDIGINIQSRFKKVEILEQLQRAEAAGVSRAVLTGCSLKSSRQGLELSQAWHGVGEPDTLKKLEVKYPVDGATQTPIRLYATVGVHPHDAKEIADETSGVNPEKLEILREMAANPFCVSLGECGLDYDRMFSPMESQKFAFDAQVALAAELKRPLFVHLRERDADKGEPLGAVQHCADILAKYADRLDPSRVCIHCFTGSTSDLVSLTSKGYCIGLTGFVGMLSRAEGTGTLDAIADESHLAFDRLMIETDSPFMRPDKSWFPEATGFRKARNNEPAAMPAVCLAVASRYAGGRYGAADVARQTTANAMRFFGFEEADELIAASHA
mmetsp:Transcript_13706/g.26533  ORF Transcript_13706/g.26533 Transcript_13706/m.26533 type:complete len:438 (-) Transcript_13706:64-1377(-)